MSASHVTGFGVHVQPVQVVPPVRSRKILVSVVPAGQAAALSITTPSAKLFGSVTHVATSLQVASAQSVKPSLLLSTLSKQFSRSVSIFALPSVTLDPAALALPAEPPASVEPPVPVEFSAF